MASIEKFLLQSVKKKWHEEFPFLKPARIKQISGVRKDACYLCDSFAQSRNRYYFVTFEFHPKQPGQFSISITISDSIAEPLQESFTETHLSPDKIGTFTIAAFLGKPSFSWMLYDWDAQNVAYWKSLGADMPSVRGLDLPNIWKPSSFELPPERIVEETIQDINDKLKKQVFPKLQIDWQLKP